MYDILQDVSKKVDKKSGIWRLWDQPLAIPRASERLPNNEPRVKKEVYLEMEVDESQFERTKEDEEKLKEFQRRGGEFQRMAMEKLEAKRIAMEKCSKTKLIVSYPHHVKELRYDSMVGKNKRIISGVLMAVIMTQVLEATMKHQYGQEIRDH